MPHCPKHCYFRHRGTPHEQCSRRTKQGKPCPHHADRLHGGKPVCHVHDPNGTAAKNLADQKSKRVPNH